MAHCKIETARAVAGPKPVSSAEWKQITTCTCHIFSWMKIAQSKRSYIFFSFFFFKYFSLVWLVLMWARACVWVSLLMSVAAVAPLPTNHYHFKSLQQPHGTNTSRQVAQLVSWWTFSQRHCLPGAGDVGSHKTCIYEILRVFVFSLCRSSNRFVQATGSIWLFVLLFAASTGHHTTCWA